MRLFAFFTITSMALCFNVQAQINFRIKGKVPANIPADRAALTYNGNDYKMDTVLVKNGSFEFKVTADRPDLVAIDLIVPRSARSNGKTPPSAFFYMDKGLMSVEFDTAGRPKITGGGKEQEIYEEFTNRKMDPKNFGMETQAEIAGLIKKYPDSYVSFDKLEYGSVRMQPKIANELFAGLSQRIQKSKDGVEFKNRIDLSIRFDVGKPAINFTVKDTEGRAVSLNDFKGKFVLLDFWASWCGPCRATHPGLKNTYAKFKDKNFEILAVSLDTKQDLWLKAIKEDQITWVQVRDSKDAAANVAAKYGISQIPQSLLIDPDGNILGRNLKGQALDTKLSQVLK